MRYYLVELIASNRINTIHSSCIVKAKFLQKPPIEICYKNLKDQGYGLINVVSVTRVGKKTAEYLMEHIKSMSTPVSSLEKAVAKIQEQVKNSSIQLEQEFSENSQELDNSEKLPKK